MVISLSTRPTAVDNPLKQEMGREMLQKILEVGDIQTLQTQNELALANRFKRALLRANGAGELAEGWIPPVQVLGNFGNTDESVLDARCFAVCQLELTGMVEFKSRPDIAGGFRVDSLRITDLGRQMIESPLKDKELPVLTKDKEIELRAMIGFKGVHF